jgi:hypothetical protein
VVFLKGPGLHYGTGKKQLQSALTTCVTPDVTISEENIFYLHRVRDDMDVYFFVNTGLEARTGVEITFELQGIPEEWDPNTGAITPIHVYDLRRGRTAVTMDFPPAEARVVVMRKGKPAAHVVATNLRVLSFDGTTLVGALGGKAARIRAEIAPGKRRLSAPAQKPLGALKLPSVWNVSIEGDNTFLVQHFQMLVGEPSPGVDVTDPSYDDSSWLQVKPGAWEMQLPQERDEASYPVTLWYRAEVHAELLPPDLRLLIDGFSGGGYTLFVNGTEVTDRGTRSSLDAEIKEVRLADYFQVGRNVLAIRLMAGRRTDGVLDPLKLIGKFTVLEQHGTMRMAAIPDAIRVGDITLQGYPFFSGTMVYSGEVKVPAAYMNGKAILEAECGDDVLEVHVNGNPAGLCPWHPYQMDITGLLQAGKNTITLKVTNTLINMLEGVRRPSGLRAIPRILHEHVYTFQFR